MTKLATVTVIGRDKTGVIAWITNFLLLSKRPNVLPLLGGERWDQGELYSSSFALLR